MDLIKISEEFLVQPFLGGIRLIPPQDNMLMFSSVKKYFLLPTNSYFLGVDGTIIDLNEQTFITNLSKLASSSTKKSVLNQNIKSFLNPESAKKLIHNGMTVVQEKKIKIFEEEVESEFNDNNLYGISFKFPFYNNISQVIGIFGISILTDNFFKNPLNGSFKDSLELIVNTGLLHQTSSVLPGKEILGIYLTAREFECLKLFSCGMTIKMVAKKIGLSPRTVEDYLNNLKEKFNVRSKPELIDKIMYSFAGI